MTKSQTPYWWRPMIWHYGVGLFLKPNAAPRRLRRSVMKSNSHDAARGDSRKADRATRGKEKPKGVIPVWTGPTLPRIASGCYMAAAVRIIGPQYLARWKRYSVGIGFRPFSEP